MVYFAALKNILEKYLGTLGNVHNIVTSIILKHVYVSTCI